jgi:hypothetical protein
LGGPTLLDTRSLVVVYDSLNLSTYAPYIFFIYVIIGSSILTDFSLQSDVNCTVSLDRYPKEELVVKKFHD